MNDSTTSEALFDAILEVAIEKAFEKEMSELPSSEELNKIYKPSMELDKRIKKLINQKNRKLKMKQLARNLGKIAACTCIIFAVFFSILLSIDATRNLIFNFIIELKEKHTQIRLNQELEINSYRLDPPLLENFCVELSLL